MPPPLELSAVPMHTHSDTASDTSGGPAYGQTTGQAWSSHHRLTGSTIGSSHLPRCGSTGGGSPSRRVRPHTSGEGLPLRGLSGSHGLTTAAHHTAAVA